MNTAVLKPLMLTGALVLSPLASAELQIGGSGGANTIQAKFEAFSLCNQNAKAKGLGDAACDKEAQALRDMIGGGRTASTANNQAKTHNAALKQDTKK